MKEHYDKYCEESSIAVTRKYSTSFYKGTSLIDSQIRNDIHAIYGFVRFADEIVDSFHGFDKATLLSDFKSETFKAIDQKISLNPILHSFQATVNLHQINHDLIKSFFHSMEMDLIPVNYDQQIYNRYIFGSAEAVGLMCLKVFVHRDKESYEKLKPYARKLGSAFQKINFLRDLKADMSELGRLYFPDIKGGVISNDEKKKIEIEIEQEFHEAYTGIKMLPKPSRFGVYISYIYYKKLLDKIKRKTVNDLMESRIRVSNIGKYLLFIRSYLRNATNTL